MIYVALNTRLRQKSLTQNNLNQAGFSLIELMVGLIVGLLATLVIMQVFSTFEGNKRTTSGNSDAQTSGSIALMNIQRDVQNAGFGLPIPNVDKGNNALNCAVIADYDPDNNAATNNSTNLFPIVIQNGAAATDSDTITVRYSTNAAGGGVPVEIVSNANATTAVGMVLSNNIGCNNNDIALITNGNACRMTTIADANGTPDTKINIRLNALTPAGNPLSIGAKLTCMGNWQNYTYTVVNNELRRNDVPIIGDVVNMQAQYGISATPDSNQVTQWVNATGVWAAAAGATPTTPTVANRNRIKAIRVAVVVRNGLLEKNVVTTAAPVAWTPLAAPVTAAPSPAPVINLTNTPQWNQYRYRVFNTIFPIRNMLWNREAFE